MLGIGKIGENRVYSLYQMRRGRVVPDYPVWSIAEASRETGYHPEYIRRLIRNGKVEATRIGHVYLVKVSSLKAYMAAQDPTDARTGPRSKKG